MEHGSVTYAHYLQTCLLNNSCSVLAENLPQTVSITDSEIKGSVSFWDLLGADYSQLTPTSQTLWSVLLPACTALTGSPWQHGLGSSKLCTCKDASLKILWFLKVWEKWMLAGNLSFINLDPSFHLCPCEPLPCLASLTVLWCWIWGVEGITFSSCWTGF